MMELAEEREKRTFFRIYLVLEVEVHPEDDQVGDDVERADAHEDLRVIERDLFGDLHHSEDDHQVCARAQSSVCG